ncbi:hypothetical protein J4438_01220 [Candidatus Woesearchaeota archaeon]|uniref:R15P Isomerase n=1 Tax=uncultured Candidatus Woesearchaeota archaeon TaxID=2014372 RepID=A0A447IU91_9ARCH|nr:hypothetical protein [Candidatus Woesearchaeota archaeon]VDS11094.1 R15P Isomerase [uncultured Candidatus Woesearchaeota archaeon]
MSKFNKIVKDIKSLNIQGARDIAFAALNAYSLKNDSKSIKKLINARPTEPCLRNIITFAQKTTPLIAHNYFNNINKKTEINASKLIKRNNIIFTHCHSTSVTKSLILAKKHTNFQVYNTETRPLYQGRRTARELAKYKIKVTHFVDSGADLEIRKSDIIFLGADMITNNGEVYNKIGSFMISELAKKHNKKLYIVSNSWKYYPKHLDIEQRNPKEVWDINKRYIEVKNPAFEKVPRKNINGICSELGILSPKRFVKQVKKEYPWIK